MRRTVPQCIDSLNYLADRNEAPAGSFLAYWQTGGPGQERSATNDCFDACYLW